MAQWCFYQSWWVQAFTLKFAPGDCPLDMVKIPVLEINGQGLEVPQVRSDRSWEVHMVKSANGRWQIGNDKEESGLKKTS